jgi:hypothetical protein
MTASPETSRHTIFLNVCWKFVCGRQLNEQQYPPYLARLYRDPADLCYRPYPISFQQDGLLNGERVSGVVALWRRGTALEHRTFRVTLSPNSIMNAAQRQD